MKNLYTKIFSAVVGLTMSAMLSAQYSNGFIVTNEGNFGSPNAEISYIEGNTVTNNVYSTVNNEPLGDVLQWLHFYDDKAALVVNNSNKVVIVDRSSFVKQATLTSNVMQPRSATVIDGKIYITNNGTGQKYISVHDAASYAWITNITLGSAAADEIHAVNGKIYVMRAAFSSGNSIDVIDPATNTITQNITLDNGLQSVKIVGTDAYALCSNASTGTTLYKINTNTNSVVGQINNPAVSNAWKLAIDGSNAYIKSGLNVYQISLDLSAFPSTPLFVGQGTDSWGSGFYGFNAIDGKIYQINANEYTAPSSVHRYTSTGTFETTYTVGMIGNGIYKNIYTPLATTDATKVKFTVYPNPVTDVLFIKSDQKIAYQIFDMTGRMVKSGNYSNGIDIRNLAKGMYLLKTTAVNQTNTTKFIVK